MTFRARLAALFRPRAAGRLSVAPPNWFLLSPWLKEAGVMVTPDSAVQVAAVYGCCRLIVDCLAPAPITVTEIRRGGVRETLHDDPVAWTLNYGASVRDAPDALTPQAVEEALYWSALSGDGNGYAEIQRDNAGRLFAMWPIDPARVTPKRDETGFYYEIAQYQGGPGRLEAIDCFHVHGPSLKGWVGDSIVYRAAKAIGAAHAQQIYRAAYFANGTVIAGVLTSEKNVTPAQAKQARERWEDEHGGGPGNAHGLSVVGQGFKYQAVNHDAQQAMLVEAARFQVQEIARFYGVPTTLLADNEAWTNLGELYLGFYRNALRPWAERFDAEATRKLFPQRLPWREVQHDLTHLTLGSFKDQIAALSQAVNDGIWTRNEARAVVGKNSVPGGDVLMVQSTVKPLDQLLEEQKTARLNALPEVYQYHLEQGIPTKNEVRERLGLPPVEGGDEFTEPAQIKIDRQQADLQEPADPDNGAEPEEPPDDKPAPVNTRPTLSARDAVTAMFADAFARHARRIRDDRPRSAEGLAQDCAAAWALATRALPGDAAPMDLAPFADALEQGEPPDKAAERFVEKLWIDRDGEEAA
jgi:HK97 family phage portal protein